MEMNSQSGDTLSSGPSAYSGPTVKYELNKTYHVTVNYDDDHKILSMRVNEKLTGKEIWGYFVNTAESLHGMNRIFIGSKGDYGAMNVYALGYIDNVRLTTPAAVTATPTEQVTTVTTVTTKNPTTKQTSSIPTPYPTDYTEITHTRYPCDSSTWHYRYMGCSGQDKKELITYFF